MMLTLIDTWSLEKTNISLHPRSQVDALKVNKPAQKFIACLGDLISPLFH